MKHLTVDQLSEPLQESIRSLSSEQILITEEGKPIALLLNLEDTNIPVADLETWSLKVSPTFWRMIDDRRTRPTIPLVDLETALGTAPEPDENSRLTYKGYQAVVEYEEDEEIFVGQVLNCPETILFEGESRETLEQHFTEAIDQYLQEAEPNSQPTPNPSQEGNQPTPNPSQEGNQPTSNSSQEGNQPTSNSS